MNLLKEIILTQETKDSHIYEKGLMSFLKDFAIDMG